MTLTLTDGFSADEHAARQAALAAALAAYDSRSLQLLTDVADRIGISFAYVDRITIEAYLERRLTNDEWDSVNTSFGALDLDDHLPLHDVADWIDAVVVRAEVIGRRDDDLPPAEDEHQVHVPATAPGGAP